MNNCKNCKFWAGVIGGTKLPFMNACGDSYYEMFGGCGNPKLATQHRVVNNKTNAINLSGASMGEREEDGSSVYFFTGPDFGCIHYEPK